jgi:amino acid permease
MQLAAPLLDNNNKNPDSRNVSIDKDRLRQISISEEDGRKVSSSLLENPFLAKLGSEQDLQEGYHVGFQEATWTSCYINLLNTIVGSGMLGLPWAFAQTGWILGTILLLGSAATSIFSLHILSICATKTPQPSSFYSVTEATLPNLTFLVDLAVFLQCYGVCISYLIVISGLMPQVLSGFGVNEGFITDRITWVIIGFCVVAPLSCLKNLDALKYTSGFAMVFVICLTLLIGLYAFGVFGLDPCEDYDLLDGGVCEGEKSNAILSLETFHSLSIFIFAFSCQPNIFAVVNELRKPSQQRFNSVINMAIGMYYIIFLSFIG